MEKDEEVQMKRLNRTYMYRLAQSHDQKYEEYAIFGEHQYKKKK